MEAKNSILDAAYTSPSGKRQTFIFENVSRNTNLKTAATTFPELDGALIQDLGVGGREFPFICIFSGANCMQEADSFEELLKERGVGILEHPIYGVVNVVPTGGIKRTDNLISNFNESTVEITFSETLVVETYPASEVEVSDKIKEVLDEYDMAAANEYADFISIENVDERLQFESVTKKQTEILCKNLNKIFEKIPGEKNEFKQKLDDAKTTIKDFISNIHTTNDSAKNYLDYAVSLADVTIQTIRLPARTTGNYLAKANGYGTIIKDTINNAKADPFGVNAIKNQFAITKLILGSAVVSTASGIALTANEKKGDKENGAIVSKYDALNAVDEIQTLFNEYKKYIDKENGKNNFVAAGGSYEKVLDVVTLSIQTIIQLSINLVNVRIVTLDRERQLIEFLCEVYGKDGFDKIDEFITENKLNADEIVCLPMGREVRYYV